MGKVRPLRTFPRLSLFRLRGRLHILSPSARPAEFVGASRIRSSWFLMGSGILLVLSMFDRLFRVRLFHDYPPFSAVLLNVKKPDSRGSLEAHG